MKNRGQKIGITIVAMIILWIVAYLFHERFFHFVLGHFKDLNLQLQTSELLGILPKALTFASVISILPALFLFSHFVLKDQKTKVFFVNRSSNSACRNRNDGFSYLFAQNGDFRNEGFVLLRHSKLNIHF